jgi:Na+/H+ antiporter NhaD/arsenite permease-like protein
VFFSGNVGPVSVPVFKTLTHLPPLMGILIGLGVLMGYNGNNAWKESCSGKTPAFRSARHCKKVDSPTILFFLGILLAITAFQSSGILAGLAEWMSKKTGNEHIIAIMLWIIIIGG